MANRIACILDHLIDSVEVETVVRALGAEGYQVEMIGRHADEPARGQDETAAVVALGADQARVGDYDGLLIAGSSSIWQSLTEPILHFIRAFDGTRRPLAAASYAIELLRLAGLVGGRTIAAPPDLVPVLERAGADLVTDAVVVDENWITSRAAGDALLLAETFLERLAELRGEMGAFVPEHG